MPYRFQEVYKHPRQYGSHVYQENFRDEQHQILLTPSRRNVEGEYTVPEGHYFMMGDNRDNSADSRYDCPGFVPWNHFVGTATRIWFNWDFENAPEWQRIGQKIE
jgi:signal peptidase I